MIAPMVDRFVLEVEETLLGWTSRDRRKLRRLMTALGRDHAQFREVVRFVLDEPDQLDAIAVDERGVFLRVDAAGAFARWRVVESTESRTCG